jgi:hypothetical protein
LKIFYSNFFVSHNYAKKKQKLMSENNNEQIDRGSETASNNDITDTAITAVPITSSNTEVTTTTSSTSASSTVPKGTNDSSVRDNQTNTTQLNVGSFSFDLDSTSGIGSFNFAKINFLNSQQQQTN